MFEVKSLQSFRSTFLYTSGGEETRAVNQTTNQQTRVLLLMLFALLLHDAWCLGRGSIVHNIFVVYDYDSQHCAGSFKLI